MEWCAPGPFILKWLLNYDVTIAKFIVFIDHCRHDIINTNYIYFNCMLIFKLETFMDSAKIKEAEHNLTDVLGQSIMYKLSQLTQTVQSNVKNDCFSLGRFCKQWL